MLVALMPVPEHVRRLRSKIGPELLLLPSVTVLAGDEQGRVLLVRHATGLWGTVGGAVEVDEAPEVSGVREAEEETGLHVVLG